LRVDPNLRVKVESSDSGHVEQSRRMRIVRKASLPTQRMVLLGQINRLCAWV